MFRFIFSKLLGMMAVLAIVAVLVFILTRAASGDPIAVLLGDLATAADIARVRVQYGLDKPLPTQFIYWLGQVLHGNLGESIFLQEPVAKALAQRAGLTTLLTIMSVAFAALVGIPCGIAAAVYRGRAADQGLSGLAMLGASIPSFWLGLVLIQIFAVKIGWFPVSGYGPPDAGFWQHVHALVLPSFTLGLINSALILRFTRASMLDVLGEDYVRTARAKGLTEWIVVLKHALRNALVPVVTVVGLTAALMIGGAIVTETVFSLPGAGNLIVNAVLRRDYPVIQGALLAVAAIYVIINFGVDLLYAVIDPRVRV